MILAGKTDVRGEKPAAFSVCVPQIHSNLAGIELRPLRRVRRSYTASYFFFQKHFSLRRHK
jgi:hypothetical protein